MASGGCKDGSAEDMAQMQAKMAEQQAEDLKLVKELEAARKTIEEEMPNAEEVEEVKDVTKTQKPCVALLGQHGVGKTSLVSVLAETFVPQYHYNPHQVPEVYESSTTEYCVVPGCTEERSFTNLKQIMATKAMHLVIIMYQDRVEHITKLEKFIKLGTTVPYVCVRNKVDQLHMRWKMNQLDQGNYVDADGGAAHELQKEALEHDAEILARRHGTTPTELLTAMISTQKEGVKVCFTTSLAGSPLGDSVFSMQATLVDLQAEITSKIKPGARGVSFLTDDGNEVKDGGLKDHSRLAVVVKWLAPLIFVSAKTREGIDSLKAEAKKEGVLL